MESHVRGGTRWRRFAVVMVPSVAATAAIGVALAQGALAASFSVSGQQFKVTANTLHGEGFEQYGALDVKQDGKYVPVAVSAFTDATITGLCQSVVVPTPIGDVTLKLTAGNGGKKVTAHNLYIDLDQLDADATFNNINIGVAAGAKGQPGPGIHDKDAADPNSFAQTADSADLTDVKQTAWATSAGTFRLAGLSLRVHLGSGSGVECY
ncbi:MAG: cholesterol esterase [Streptomyces sp.]|nr:cholesterol esterase [Streptomyces sp.]